MSVSQLFATARRRKSQVRASKLRSRSHLFEPLEGRQMLAMTWGVQSDFFGTRDTVSQTRSLRGLALSPDEQHVYTGFIQGTSSAAIREVSAGINASLIGNGAPGAPYPIAPPGNPSYSAGVEASVVTFNQRSGIASDDRGLVYTGLNASVNQTSQNWGIYSANLASQIAVRTSTNATSSQIAGIATAKLGGNYYVYVGWGTGLIERWNANTAASPFLDTSWGAVGTPGKINLKTFDVESYLNGLEVDTDGTIFVAGGLQGTTVRGDALIKIPAAAAAVGNLAAITFVNVSGGANGLGGFAAMDVALYAGKAYVTQYLQTNSTISSFYTLDLSFAGNITPPVTTMAGPSGKVSQYNSDAVTDSGFSAIEITSDGRMYLAEQLYNFTVPAGSYTPPGGVPMTGTRIYFDRVLVSTVLDNLGPVTSAVVAAPNPAIAGAGTLITLTANVDDQTTNGSTIAGAEYSVNGGATWIPMAALDGTFDEVSENVGATFTLGAAGFAAPGNYNILVRGSDSALQIGANGSTVLTVIGTAPSITSTNATTFVAGTFGSFVVTTNGIPTPALSETGALPTGVTFVDNGDGTATLSGTPATGTGNSYGFTITASNGVLPDATQAFTLTVNEAPTITSANDTVFTVGALGSFTVTTGHHFPSPAALTATGPLPNGVTFVDNGDGTATLSGTALPGQGGVFTLGLTANNGVAPNGTQSFTLVVNEAPVITSANSTTFIVGTFGVFTVTTASHFPFPAEMSEIGAMPNGVTFVDNFDGTATISGTPLAGEGGVYTLGLTADNGISPNGTQTFTLTVNEAPTITSANTTTFTVGSFGTFAVTTGDHFPSPATLSSAGALPAGVTFTDNGDGTATLSGTPGPGTQGSYSLTFTADNGVAPNGTQAFTLIVNPHPADFGDAPDTYGTLLPTGARHLATGPLLGTLRDSEANGQPNPTATGDGADEDGITLPSTFFARGNATIGVTASASARLDAWIDYNGNGSFDPAEKIATNLLVPAGSSSFTIAVPSTIVAGASYARFRLSTAGIAAPTGQANDGEVEDYSVSLAVPAPGSIQVVDDPENPGSGLLLIRGTNAHEAIRVQPGHGLQSDTVSVFLSPTTFVDGIPLSSFDRILIYGEGGNDSIVIHPFIVKPATIYGDAGNDAISGGGGNDSLFGGDGIDSLAGNDGDDLLDGGASGDTLNGGSGFDRLSEAGSGNFLLSNSSLRIGALFHAVAGVEFATLTGSSSSEVFNFAGWTGSAIVDGAGGSNTVSDTANANYVLTPTLLTRTIGATTTTIQLTGIQNASLTGGASNNTFDLTAWPLAATLNGSGGTDSFSVLGDVSYTLSDTMLLRPALPMIRLSGFENASLTAGASNNTFTVSGWTKAATLNGDGGIDKVIASGNVNFTLSDTSLTRSVGGAFTLSSIEQAELTGGAGNNNINATAFTGDLKINGAGGNDTIKSGIGLAILLGGAGNDIITGGSGRAVMIGGVGLDKLTGGANDDLLVDGTTIHDNNAAALALIMAEWASASAYSLRVAHLTGTPGGLNGSTHLGGANVIHDTSVDILLGAGGDDLFFAKLVNPAKDSLGDKTGTESAI